VAAGKYETVTVKPFGISRVCFKYLSHSTAAISASPWRTGCRLGSLHTVMARQRIVLAVNATTRLYLHKIKLQSSGSQKRGISLCHKQPSVSKISSSALATRMTVLLGDFRNTDMRPKNGI
jgi:hypothetical protein